ncbi:hypothetical protein HY642_06365 [Candidatus Woesearchaeota archaeon]|nr:hypothetical protein [Candidatus Woesearchaeota archaeon]
MKHSRTLTGSTRPCKCGGIIRQDRCLMDQFLVTCLKCDTCNETVFTPQQTKELIRLREANEAVEGRRKIVKVGTSIAALLPKKVTRFGIKEGLIDEVRVLSTRSLELRFSKDIL